MGMAWPNQGMGTVEGTMSLLWPKPVIRISDQHKGVGKAIGATQEPQGVRSCEKGFKYIVTYLDSREICS